MEQKKKASEEDFLGRIKHKFVRSLSESEQQEGDLMEEAATGTEDRYEFSMDRASSCLSMDGLNLDLLGDEASSFRLVHRGEEEDGGGATNSSGGSSPLGWPLGKRERLSADPSPSSSNLASGRHTYMREQTMEKRVTPLTEVEMMKEKFAKLLLGEDMSGGAKGVCTAMAISNAITNLSASVFGQLWRLEPFTPEQRAMWQREMKWLLSVSDHIMELVPSWQTFPDGSTLEVMINRPRSDVHLNLPVLRKLDNMLLDTLDSFHETEFWYVDRGIAVAEKHNCQGSRDSCQRQQEKWWLPTPQVPVNGLSEESRKRLHHQRDATSRILKAAMAINTRVLSQMEVPQIYLNSLPKNGRSSLGDVLYRSLCSDNFSTEVFLSKLDTSDEHNILDVANRLETAILVWGQQTRLRNARLWAKEKKFNAKSSWGKMREFVGDVDRRLLLADRVERVLAGLKQQVPGLPQTSLDTNKILFNRDVGQSILESYSRVLESLAFNIIARIDDVLYADDLVIRFLAVEGRDCITKTSHLCPDRSDDSCTMQLTAVSTPYDTPLVSHSASPTSPHMTPSPPRENIRETTGSVLLFPSFDKASSDYTDSRRELPEGKRKQLESERVVVVKLLPSETKCWTYAGNLENRNPLHSPPGRD
ncbi:hypothetical protein BDL97_11G092600 [Sphagnum fallax]|nr:hypothetical protein BDL97_11G092600 [Sphagnum fallax]